MIANPPGSEFIPGNCFGTFKLPDPVALLFEPVDVPVE